MISYEESYYALCDLEADTDENSAQARIDRRYWEAVITRGYELYDEASDFALEADTSWEDDIPF